MSNSLKYRSTGNKLDLPRGSQLPISMIEAALERTNAVFRDLTKVAPYVYELLGMRNLSAFVGAAFARELQDASKGLLLLNPHQDGYPDLLLLDEIGKREFDKVKSRIHAKEPFSPFPTGGIEIKATVGDVPSEKQLAAKGLGKPQIGDTRVHLISGISWKAHHRETNNLLAIIWDFKDAIPAIMIVSYSSNLDEADWGKIVQPREGGGRTTSVSIMSKAGVAKLLNNALLVVDDSRYISLVEKHIGTKLNLR
jgi:hypothetical protein